MKYKLLILFLLLVLLTACTDKDATNTVNIDSPDKKTHTFTVLPEDICGLENCHGLEFSCGGNVPDICTELYAPGDFCRQFAVCETIDNKCRLVTNQKLDFCKSCVSDCLDLEGMPYFDCENKCREELQ